MRTGLQIALVVGGGIFFSAQASADDTTTGLDSLAGGTQVVTAVVAPVTVSGNAVSVVGDSRSSHRPAATGSGHGSATKAGSATTSGEESVLGGTQVVAPVTAPVTVGGNAVSVVGDSRSDGATTGGSTGSPGAGQVGSTTSGEESVLGGTQVVAPVTAPVTVGGNAVSVVGDSTTADPVTPVTPAGPVAPTDPATPTDPTDPTTPGSGPAGSVVSAGTMTRTVTAMTAAAPALSRLAQTGAATGLLVGSALLLLLVGGLLTMVGRRRGDLLTA